MTHRSCVPAGTLALAVCSLVFAPATARAQSGLEAVDKAAAALAPKGWTPPRTPEGYPDLEGIYTNVSLTPLQREKDLGTQQFFTPQESSAWKARMLKVRNMDRRDGGAVADLTRAYNEVFWDNGSEVSPTLQTSLIVDPADGRMPAFTEEAQHKMALKLAEIKERCADPTRACPLTNGGQPWPADGPEDRPAMERCIVWPTAGPPMLPSAYDSNYQIAETKNSIMIYVEAIHDVRVIPLDGRPHLPSNIRQLLGDSRGHWEGDTLVVDTTNFNDEPALYNADQNLHVTERFKKVSPDVLLYEFTVEDPTVFTRAWSGAIAMTKIKGPLFEYACNEGNYGLQGILKGARVEEKKHAEAKAEPAGR
ncbi:MAG TPA: hypothetical protein VMH80_02165 [Bryobacteraceae bacterium]|nr:hypothetical protein [Bryobacteraceae bacterium]